MSIYRIASKRTKYLSLARRTDENKECQSDMRITVKSFQASITSLKSSMVSEWLTSSRSAPAFSSWIKIEIWQPKTLNIHARITLNDGIGEIVRQSKNCGPKFFDDDVTFGSQFRVVDDFGNQLMDAGFIDDDSILERDEGLLIVS